MNIEFVEISNFRKLLAVRVDVSPKTTLFVGANNSGKTSAMQALRKFLSPPSRAFEPNDITLCRWPAINSIGQQWEIAHTSGAAPQLSLDEWHPLMPQLDLWLRVAETELHHVRDLIPTLDWSGGLIGVRLILEPKDIESLYKEYIAAVAEASQLKSQTPNSHNGNGLTVWPTDLIDFMGRKLSQQFTVRAYALDPSELKRPDQSQAEPQNLPHGAVAVDGEPLKGLIRVNEIGAQRGLGEPQTSHDGDEAPALGHGSSLSEQLRDYYKKHLDPTDRPGPSDLTALQAIEAAQLAFDDRLSESFAAAFSEVEQLGYPGVTDPKPRVSTRLRAIDGLNHAGAVSFEVEFKGEDGKAPPVLRLPEGNTGLGYQNLIAMIFRLMSFRDAWMRVGKAEKTNADAVEPLQLVLVEEPEAHLHAQVQQVFINKAYDVLRAHVDLGSSSERCTQLIVSTHSSHIAHELDFECLRYFRRLPAGYVAEVPVSTVVNLTEVFGKTSETRRFVTRYLRAQHADLFFADAVIMVEGPAERMILPNLIRLHHKFLSQCYITTLEIGGSHAHRLRALIEHLGLLTLIITDLDSVESGSRTAKSPRPGDGLLTNNATLKEWVPGIKDVDSLLVAQPHQLVIKDRDPLFQVRVAFQQPIETIRLGQSTKETAYPYTFEDALAFANLKFFADLPGGGLVGKFREAITNGGSVSDIGDTMFAELRRGKKAELALEILESDGFDTLVVPPYIEAGLLWLTDQLRRKQAEAMTTAGAA